MAVRVRRCLILSFLRDLGLESDHGELFEALIEETESSG